MTKKMLEEFTKDCHIKFTTSSLEKNKSLDPWNYLNLQQLFERLIEEAEELKREIFEQEISDHKIEKDGKFFLTNEKLERIMDECTDVSNFCWFIYERAKLLKREENE